MRHATVSVDDAEASRAPAASLRQLLSGLHKHAPLVAAVAFFLAMFWPFMRKGEQGEWRRCFLRAAGRLQAREILHWPDEVNTYAYPPAMAMLAVPLAKLPFRWSLAGWYVVNVAAMMAAITCAWRLTGGPSFTGLRRPWSLVFWLGLLLASRFLTAPLENQQFDVVIAACLLAGCLALARGNDNLAALWLGVGAAMKCTPFLFVPYLVWRGKVRAAALMVLAAVTINCLPDLIWPRPNGGSYLGDWIGVFLLKAGRSAPGVWDSDLILNQSLAGLMPACTVANQQCMGAGGNLAADLFEMLVHRFGVDAWHDDGSADATRRTDGAEDVNGIVPVVAHHRRTRADRRPNRFD
ncbi:MAG: hypothetical protein B7Z73_11520 [Planctomycetia bacterium 21-64-5]|nr:MAG: hypothetical protein B7Z73_11520 [Planctomycetia bacterium 21-64-5]